MFIKFNVKMPNRKFIKNEKELEILSRILPGPKYNKIDYNEKKYEILDEYDETDFTTNAEGMGGHGQ